MLKQFISILLLAANFCLATTTVAQVPPGLPSNAYYGNATLTGVYVNGNSLYLGNYGARAAQVTSTAGFVIYKHVTVTEVSELAAVTVAGLSTLTSMSSAGFTVTVDPADAAVAASNLFSGQIATEAFSVSQTQNLGPIAIGNPVNVHDILLSPADGEGPILQPGDYYVSVFATSGGGGGFAIAELQPSTASSDRYSSSIVGPCQVPAQPNCVQDLQGQSVFPINTSLTLQTGDMAYDVWFIPVEDESAITCSPANNDRLALRPYGIRPNKTFVAPFDFYEIQEKEVVRCHCNGSCGFTNVPNTAIPNDPAGQTQWTIYNRNNGCSVLGGGWSVPYTNPVPLCGYLNLSSTSVTYNLGNVPFMNAESCNFLIDINTWSNGAFFSASFAVTPSC
ncbi:MAG: hypothetical protein KDD70_06625 [Bdellovibrionales bacterium]|nr:hypothetical protein [Bdellovibrionales bacterium]